ncbi:hypothetical protein N7524_008725 [Penicillium chrysogenum]|nr:hypothetical protein N7524_008725 [Penicillium chrysogenum]
MSPDTFNSLVEQAQQEAADPTLKAYFPLADTCALAESHKDIALCLDMGQPLTKEQKTSSQDNWALCRRHDAVPPAFRIQHIVQILLFCSSHAVCTNISH